MIRFPTRKGWAIGDGWVPLVEECIEKLTHMCENFDIQITQIKEKFGELRIYIESGTDEMFDLIDLYEQMSLHICEVCGEPGEKRTGSYLQILCDEHAKKD